MAELAQNRESQEYLRLQEYLRQEKHKQDNVDRQPVSSSQSVASNYSEHRYNPPLEQPVASIAAGGINDYFRGHDPNVDVDALLRGSLGNDVFERLSTRGKIHAERKKLLQEREQALNLARHSFQPQLNPSTDHLAAKYYQRKFNNEHSRERESFEQSQRGRSRSRSRESFLGHLAAPTSAREASSRSASRDRSLVGPSSAQQQRQAQPFVRSQSAPATRRPMSASSPLPSPSASTSASAIGASLDANPLTPSQQPHQPSSSLTVSTSMKPIQRSSSPPLPSYVSYSTAHQPADNNRPALQSRRSRSRQELVQEDIEKVRAKSRERRDAQVRHQMKRQYLVTASNASTTSANTAQTSHATNSSAEEPMAPR